MFKPVPVAIGLRYLRAKRRNGFISFISLASILGIALGVTALITTLAVMSGFQREIRDRMLQMAAHATVSGYGEPLQDWRHAVDVAMQDKRIAGAALDVFEHEPKVPRALFALDNVVLLPHIASATEETRQAMADRVVDNLDAFFASGKLISPAA